MLTATATYNMVMKDLSSSLERTAQQPVVERETAYYEENISSAKSIDDFLANDRLYRYAMKAHGLEDMIYAKAFMRKVLEEGIHTKTAFANKLVDTRYREFAKAFDFEAFGSATTVTSEAQHGTVDKYLRQTLEEDVGAQNEGARLALYFERTAPSITSTMNLLGDSALLKVVQVAFGFSEATGAMDVDKQVAMIEKRLDIADLQEPEKLKELLNRFTTLWEMENSTTASVPNVLLLNQTPNIGVDLLSAIQNLRLGGI